MRPPTPSLAHRRLVPDAEAAEEDIVDIDPVAVANLKEFKEFCIRLSFSLPIGLRLVILSCVFFLYLVSKFLHQNIKFDSTDGSKQTNAFKIT